MYDPLMINSKLESHSAMDSNSPSIVLGMSPLNSASWWLGPFVKWVLLPLSKFCLRLSARMRRWSRWSQKWQLSQAQRYIWLLEWTLIDKWRPAEWWGRRSCRRRTNTWITSHPPRLCKKYSDINLFVSVGYALLALIRDFDLVERTQSANHLNWITH